MGRILATSASTSQAICRLGHLSQDLDAVIDVGSVYDPSTHRYDHHQRGFEEVLGDGYTIRLSSADLVYKHFGKEIIAGRLGLSRDDPVVDEVFKRIYKSFIAAIDGVDNGLNQYDPGVPHRVSGW